jgi:hypothetical protein
MSLAPDAVTPRLDPGVYFFGNRRMAGKPGATALRVGRPAATMSWI